MIDTALAGVFAPSEHLVVGHAYHVYRSGFKAEIIGTKAVEVVELGHAYKSYAILVHSQRSVFAYAVVFLAVSGHRSVLAGVACDYYLIVIYVIYV